MRFVGDLIAAAITHHIERIGGCLSKVRFAEDRAA
jgi:hypothetical protein